MTFVTIAHTTRYRYALPVLLQPHRLMLLPRTGRRLRVLKMVLRTDPGARIYWSEDVWGNAVAVAEFDGPAASLLIESAVTLQLDTDAYPVFPISAAASRYPFRYTDQEWAALGVLAAQEHPDRGARLRQWATGFVARRPTDTLALLQDINVGVANAIAYQSRNDEGTQTPLATLDRGWGACRDLAVLFVEAVRSLGFGARLVSGYACDAAQLNSPSQSTHAWAEVYLPGAGWIAFDPTNRTFGGHLLAPVAVGRGIDDIMPVVGDFVGATGGLNWMEVDVRVAIP